MGKRDREGCGRGGLGCPRGGWGPQRGWGPRGGVHWGPDRQHTYHTSFSSDSEMSGDSDTSLGHKMPKKMRKHFKKHLKHWGKHWHRMGHHWPPMPPQWTGAGPSGPGDGLKTQCTLCWHRVKPLTDTEVLECGHIYHRVCLKELFELAMKASTNEEPLEVFCSHCKDKIDDNLMNEFRLRFAGLGATTTTITTDTTCAGTSGGQASTSRASDGEYSSGQHMVVDILNWFAIYCVFNTYHSNTIYFV